MELLTNYNEDTLQLISDDASTYSLPNLDGDINYTFKLSVFSNINIFLGDFVLEQNKDFYVKNNQLYLKPNELLDRENFSQSNYNLQFDFLQRYSQENIFTVTEISPSRREIRLNDFNSPISDSENQIVDFLNENTGNYNFNSFLELSQGRLIPINNYVFDFTTVRDDVTLILRLNEALPADVATLSNNVKLSNKFLASQTETIFFIDEEGLALAGRGLVPDQSFIINEDAEIDSYKNYNEITGSVGTSIIDELKRTKKDKNLNIDFSKFSNHVFFGSAEQKLKNFRDKAVKLEGLYFELSSSLSLSSSKHTVDRRKDLFKRITDVEDGFSSYEHFLYHDNQSYSTASAPGLGKNLAGSNFSNHFVDSGDNTLTKTINTEGFDVVHKKTSTSGKYLHLFTDVYNVEDAPFYNTNKDVYLSFLLRGNDTSTTKNGLRLEITGGLANTSTPSEPYKDYNYGRDRKIPFDAYSSGSSTDFSQIINPESTGSRFKRYVFKGKQEHFRPIQGGTIQGDINNISDYAAGSEQLEVISGSESVISASISGALGDDFAYGIRDSQGLHTPFFFPNYLNEDNLGNVFAFNTASVMPQGDLFPIFVDDNDNTAFFTDVKVSFDDPTDIHPFSKIHRPPSGSYAGSDKWNSWYDNLVVTASNYDNDNIHSLVNNLPLSLRTDSEHEVLRRFVNMLGEEFDLLRNYIDNYHNFYKLGYDNPNSMPDNLLPILGDSFGWKFLNPFSGSSLNDYVSSNLTEGGGVQSAINMTWKKILNNIIYVYKTKGTTESIKSLINFYGFDGQSFDLQEFGGSTEEHNPTIIENNSKGLLQGLKQTKGNVSFVEQVKPFLMLNVSSGSNFLNIDWWSNDAKPNGVEFVFNSNKSTNTQTILRSSGSVNDLWDLRLVPSASDNTTGKLEFRLNYSKTGSHDLGNNAISMSTDFIDNLMGENIFNVMLQRQYVTTEYNLTQSYQLFVGRKDRDKIQDMQIVSMSSHDIITLGALSSSNANQNFIDTGSLPTSTTKNLFVGESLSGSIAEIRAWETFLSASKFKQHILNYESTVGGSINSTKNDIIYRFPLNEGIVDWETRPNSGSLKIRDANPNKLKDFSINIADQSNLNFKSTTTEQKFFKFGVKGSDSLPNSNVTNLAPKLKSASPLSSKQEALTQPEDSAGSPSRTFSKKFGKSLSYVNTIDSILMNMMPDFRLDDYIGAPDEELTEIYADLESLRKDLITDMKISVNLESNLKSVENIMSNAVVQNVQSMTPAKTKFEFSYDVKNDTLFRSKRKGAKLLTKLNPNKAIGVIDADQFDEPNVTGSNITIHTDTIESAQLTVTGSHLTQHMDTIDAGQLLVSAVSNENFFTNNNNRINVLETSGIFQKVHYGQITGSRFKDLLLGNKNEFYKNWGTTTDNTFFYSANPGADGLYNTYKYESRFTFKTIGDTEVFMGSESIHDNYRMFENRHFVDKNHLEGYEYNSFFGDDGNGTVTGRMVGRTRFFKTDSDGNITYPSNHYINARTSKDVLLNLIYRGTQLTTSSIRPNFSPEVDLQPASPAYIINIGGSDTINRIRVERPVSSDNRTIRLLTRGPNADFTFTLLRRAEVVFTQNLNTTGTGAPNDTRVQFSLTGRPADYQFKISGLAANRVVRRVSVVNNENASFAGSRTRGRFTNIRGDFGLRIEIRDV